MGGYILSFIAAFSILASACSTDSLPEEQAGAGQKETPADTPAVNGNDNEKEESMTIKITIGDKVFNADIEDTETGKAFLAKLPLTLNMSELNGNEKYCYNVSLPRADKRYDRIAAGDLMLYSGNCVVLFYGPAGGYSYTRIGRLKSTDGLAAAVGKGSVSVTFSVK